MAAIERDWCNGSRWLSWATMGPPDQPLAVNYSYYLPEQYHFVDRADVPLNQVARITARFLARWADQYEVYRVASLPETRKQGQIPPDPQQCDRLLDDLCDWLERQVVIHFGVINLSRQGYPLLDQSNGIPGYLALTSAEFQELQENWERAGLPRTLYYNAKEQRIHIETVIVNGNPVQIVTRDSPMRWNARQTLGNKPISKSYEQRHMSTIMPSTIAGAARFEQARMRFRSSLSRRMAETEEPGCQRIAPLGIKLPILLGEVVKASVWSNEIAESSTNTIALSHTDEQEISRFPAVSWYPRQGPPLHPLPPGYHDYLPDSEHFQGHQGHQTAIINRSYTLLISTIARWADRYEAYLDAPQAMRTELCLDPSNTWRREGALPQEPDEREQFIRDTIHWLASTQAPIWARIVNLYAGDKLLLNQYDGAPGLLMLKSKQFSQLQAAWMRHGLPKDLYYRDREQCAVVEPIIYEGVVIRQYQRYSPLAWARRDLQAIATIPTPSLSQRTDAFVSACETFAQEIRLYMEEVTTIDKLEQATVRFSLDDLARLLESIEAVLAKLA